MEYSSIYMVGGFVVIWILILLLSLLLLLLFVQLSYDLHLVLHCRGKMNISK